MRNNKPGSNGDGNHRNLRRQLAWLIALTPLLMIGSCRSDAEAGGSDLTEVTLDFELFANGAVARCGHSLGRLGEGVQEVQLRDARFYLQDIAFLDVEGRHEPLLLAANDWQDGRVALLDFEDASGACDGGTQEMNTQVHGLIRAGTYVGVEFVVGVPPDLNHSSTELADPPLDLAAMSWAWQAGRRFAKIEFRPVEGVQRSDGSVASLWLIHLGSTGCSGNPVSGEIVACLSSNRVPVQLPEFDAASQRIELDLNELLRGSNLDRDEGGALGCMSAQSDPECAPLFRQMGVSLEDGTPLDAPTRAFVVGAMP